MRMLIVLGDRHSGGGAVITGSPHTDIDGVPVARVGDKATCPAHKGIFPIITGDETLIIDGKAVARHGDKLACGCSLFSGKQRLVHIDAGPSNGTMAKVAASVAQAAPNSLQPPKTEICVECLLAAAKKGAALLGR